MLEINVEFVDDLVNADGAGNEPHMERWRCVTEEIVFVEAAELRLTMASGHSRGEIYIRRGVFDVGFEEFVEVLAAIFLYNKW